MQPADRTGPPTCCARDEKAVLAPYAPSLGEFNDAGDMQGLQEGNLHFFTQAGELDSVTGRTRLTTFMHGWKFVRLKVQIKLYREISLTFFLVHTQAME
jgi:hypothetical protein